MLLCAIVTYVVDVASCGHSMNLRLLLPGTANRVNVLQNSTDACYGNSQISCQASSVAMFPTPVS